MARKSHKPEGPAEEVDHGAEDVEADGDGLDEAPFALPDSSAIDDPYLKEVWDEVLADWPGGHYAGVDPDEDEDEDDEENDDEEGTDTEDEGPKA